MATIHDIARDAGVSTATVSRVFNDSGEVSLETRTRVLKVAREANYKPHSSARNLRRAREGGKELNHVVGLVIFSERIFNLDSFGLGLTAAVEEALQGRGYGLRIITCAGEGDTPAEIVGRAVDGVICLRPGKVLADISRHVPVIILDYHSSECDTYSVIPDYRSGSREAIRRLLAAGHRRIALLSGDPSKRDPLDFTSQVVAGYQEAYEEAGLSVPEHPYLQETAIGPVDGYAAGRSLLKDRAGRPDAIVGSDGAMFGLYRAAHELGVNIPGDVSVIGIDGVSLGEYMAPPLTTIDVDLHGIGEKAVALIIEFIQKGTRRRGLEITPTVLLERASAKI